MLLSASNFEVLRSKAETPFPGWSVRQFDTMMIEPPVYLTALMRDFRQAGGRIEVREIRNRQDIQALPEFDTVVFNNYTAG